MKAVVFHSAFPDPFPEISFAQAHGVSMRLPIFLVPLIFSLNACTLLKYASIQGGYSKTQEVDPAQKNVKHLLDQENYYVLGRIIDDGCDCSNSPMVVAAYSNKYSKNERVDTMFFANIGTHYGLNLPSGSYHILIMMDENQNSIFDKNEIVGQHDIVLDKTTAPENVLDNMDILLTSKKYDVDIASINAPSTPTPRASLIYPGGSIRSLDDTIFEEGMGTLGMYDPAAFLEKSSTMFFALEEELPHKIPVVFVHGIGGSARQFSPIVSQLDRDRYKPWFFYYPSGSDLNQLAEIFYRVFLSGEVVHLGATPLAIVAHSMGGLVVREALNQYAGNNKENTLDLLVTIASPLEGHSAAALGEKHGFIVLPAWRDLNPNNSFIKELYRTTLPSFVNYQLLYAFNNSSTVKFGANSDGVVTLSSQLRTEAQVEADEQFGFNDTHAGILENRDAINQIIKEIEKIKGPFPETHLQILFTGGYDLPIDPSIDALSHYIIRSTGKYLQALITKEITPIHQEQIEFIGAATGKRKPSTDLEKAWQVFIQKYPKLITSG